MANRKPPSHRPERQMDEAARAIARAREAATKDDKPSATDTRPSVGRLGKDVISRKVVAPPAFPSTKRPKKV